MNRSAPVLLVGLGNPGASYANHRHNIGFMAADAIQRALNLGLFRNKFQGHLADGRVGTHRVFVLKPTTMMNLSGQSVLAAATFLKAPPENIWVLHDELDLAPGKVRTKTGGGHAGHNGLRSIHAAIGPDYNRVRLGIGHPGSKEQVINHVLRDFAKSEKEWLTPLIDALARHAGLLVEGKDTDFMSKVAMDAPVPKIPDPKTET